MAVYTDVTDGQLASFLLQYDIGTLIAFRGIAEGVENSNFSLRTTSGDFILTLYERRVDPDELPWFLGLMRHLAAGGINCPLPVAGRDGKPLRRLAGRHAAITTFLEGVWPRRVAVDHCRALGGTMARLHLAGQGYEPARANTLGPAAWGPLLAQSAPRADQVRSGLAAELASHLGTILASWPQDLPTGHIHADLFPDNVFFLGDALTGVIDFYFACTDQLAYDLAICLNAWCFDPPDGGDGPDRWRFRPERADALISAYDRVRPLSRPERDALPILAQGASFRFLATRLYDWLNTPDGAQVTRKDPLEYLYKLRFHAGVSP